MGRWVSRWVGRWVGRVIYYEGLVHVNKREAAVQFQSKPKWKVWEPGAQCPSTRKMVSELMQRELPALPPWFCSIQAPGIG